jgi:RNA polymerase sigma-70 factor (ECF subfamily)
MHCPLSRNHHMIKENEYLHLLWEAQSGNQENIRELVVLVRNKLYPFIYKRTMDHHSAEDLLQETLLVMIQQLRFLKRFESFWSWIHQIAWSKIQQYFRDRRRRLNIEVSVYQQYHQEKQQTVNKDLLESVAHQESIEKLFAAIRQMEPRSRKVLYLRCVQQLPYGDIAFLVQSTPNEVRVRFCRAKKILKDGMIASCA